MAALRASLSTALATPTASTAGARTPQAGRAPAIKAAARAVPALQLRGAAAGLRMRAVKRVAVVPRVAKITAEASTSNFVPVLKPEELPKGDRKVVQTGNGKTMMLFWYRNEVYAIESRSPAEGAYSTGFADAKLTQDFGIQCPSTGTSFNLKTGEIMEWYPNNPVLRAITPQDTCRPMEVFPVQVTAEAISVDPVNSNLGTDLGVEVASTAGGADTSAENNNVFGIEPKMYLEDGTELDDSSGAVGKIDPATLAISTVAIAIVAVAGTATCLYYENLVALALLWIGGFGAVAFQIYKFQEEDE